MKRNVTRMRCEMCMSMMPMCMFRRAEKVISFPKTV